MKFTSQIATTPQQSNRLLELGLKPETADCMYSVMTVSYNGYYIEEDKRHYNLCLFNQDEVQTVGFCRYEKIPAWSLGRLWELLPKSLWHDNGLEKKYHPIIEYGFVNYVTECGTELFDFDCGYEVWGSMIFVIEWLIKKKYFNKDYLEEKK